MPHLIAEHRVNPDFDDGLWAAVDVDVARYEVADPNTVVSGLLWKGAPQ
ncbi:type II toxin-antitoxin system HicB family antitoxin [Thiorhodovibrio frisius]|uniref:Uncharacterized protein n=1 Tax=Thiorhodovibrio frisius TaxID=631362 RepID=H8Z591_9GAMM|nr:hypothetical protein [Thiorhodovibrio frisius]EIC20498.1 hypothetical protein Thi970DRAFT_04136 [Thiorhodovibrio frisius]WPL21239.1 hypothetical protein Thiofri_01351 [Thiorhodovibrio frisius]